MDPSGRFTACGGEDGVVRVWRERGGGAYAAAVALTPGEGGGEPAALLLGHCGHVGDVSWSCAPAGTTSQLMLAAASDDCTVRVWGGALPAGSVVGGGVGRSSGRSEREEEPLAPAAAPAASSVGVEEETSPYTSLFCGNNTEYFTLK
jgi:WD40 repeat protein